MTEAKRVAAIILNFNGGRGLLEALKALFESSSIPTVYIVDNASTDDSAHEAVRHYPAIRLIKNEKNLGFAGGMNIGLRQALIDGAEYFWLLNDDAVAEPTALEELLRATRRRPEAGLWSPAIYEMNGTTPWFLGGRVSYFRMRTEHLQKKMSQKSDISSEFLTGCALFIGRPTLETCGLLDEHYFLYYEDAEYSLRAKRNGWLPTVVLSSRVRHAELSRDNPHKSYWLVRSGIRFFRTMSPWYWRPWVTLYLFMRKLKNTLELAAGPSPVAREVRRAYTDASQDRYV